MLRGGAQLRVQGAQLRPGSATLGLLVVKILDLDTPPFPRGTQTQLFVSSLVREKESDDSCMKLTNGLREHITLAHARTQNL
jgi:hypothetical protein